MIILIIFTHRNKSSPGEGLTRKQNLTKINKNLTETTLTMVNTTDRCSLKFAFEFSPTILNHFVSEKEIAI